MSAPPLRRPAPDETPLSMAEIAHGVRSHLIDPQDDEMPVIQRVRPAGSWEWSRVRFLRAPSVWEALL